MERRQSQGEYPQLVPFEAEWEVIYSNNMETAYRDHACLASNNLAAMYVPRSTLLPISVEQSPTTSSFSDLSWPAFTNSQSSLTNMSQLSSTSASKETPAEQLIQAQKERHRSKINERERISRQGKQSLMQEIKSYLPARGTKRRRITDKEALEWCRDLVVCVNKHDDGCPCKFEPRDGDNAKKDRSSAVTL
ncbi:hypothetical protein E3Q22_02835 [Wallemia mellicola]|uniref:Uncharacterized protein n=1 Tax=Wallemia mellicola TaxID=1708541 RepID=A0A4T0M6U5_9BASI|nr:hypothetical protein E3Q22_02835 [Wallemia mellicola]